MPQYDRSHILVPFPVANSGYRPRQNARNQGERVIDFDRRSHGQHLERQFREEVRRATEEQHTEKPEDVEAVAITFTSIPDIELAVKSLETHRRGEQPELLSVNTVETDAGTVQRATVWIPIAKISYFLTRLQKYIDTADQESPAHSALLETVGSIQRATLEALWADDPGLLPVDDAKIWWEVWLRRGRGDEVGHLRSVMNEFGASVGFDPIAFPDRIVTLVHARRSMLEAALPKLHDIAGFRRPANTIQFIGSLPSYEQVEFATELLERLEPAQSTAPAVSVLDTGVHHQHMLLKDSLCEEDCHVAGGSWPARLVCGHGTEMAGIALFGDIGEHLSSDLPVTLRHRLESVKIIPNSNDTEKHLYGAVTARSIDRLEISDSTRRRVHLLAVTSAEPTFPEEDREPTVYSGQPTSWSAAIDALAFGRAVDTSDQRITYLEHSDPEDLLRRLFVISAGNIRDPRDENHIERSDSERIEDPAQAWNAITVGAYTDLVEIMSDDGVDRRDFTPIARKGDLSPSSRTSVLFDGRWPVKPDVLAEGGNKAKSPAGDIDTVPSLSVLTTRFRRAGHEGYFTTADGTSAAAAFVASVAADIMAHYPDYWMETVRGLLVHSAEWTPAMCDEFAKEGRLKVKNVLRRRYGMGVANADRALQSASNDLALVSQAALVPFRGEDGRASADAKYGSFNLHALPWPREVLRELGSAQVRMRVTLSYFIEPNPSLRGWKGRYSYASHGLRFRVKLPTESREDFLKRINELSRTPDDQGVPTQSDTRGWEFGSTAQGGPGSLHTDIWAGSVAELADREMIAVVPVSGWWKDQKRDHSEDVARYSLIVNIATDETSVDLWQEVQNIIQSEVEIEAARASVMT